MNEYIIFSIINLTKQWLKLFKRILNQTEMYNWSSKKKTDRIIFSLIADLMQKFLFRLILRVISNLICLWNAICICISRNLVALIVQQMYNKFNSIHLKINDSWIERMFKEIEFILNFILRQLKCNWKALEQERNFQWLIAGELWINAFRWSAWMECYILLMTCIFIDLFASQFCDIRGNVFLNVW